CAGPWRSSGGWWRVADGASAGEAGAAPEANADHPAVWDRDEWDVALADGGAYRVYHDRLRDRWMVEGILD
ncbi:MAG TPA: hypothetical protein VNI83_01335, partial [Vicinamibacterales bacterium]|nr:hypothetical protein [Vicinamibacterales bacterium]